MISCDSSVRDGETNSQHVARESRNADRARCCLAEANAPAAAATDGGAPNQQGGHRIERNLDQEFFQVDGHDVRPTLSANLAMATELARPPKTPELAKINVLLKAT